MIHGSKEQIEYGQRSKYVTSVRIAHPMGGRPSPDVFGKVFHVATPLQDSVGVITPSSLHYVATTRGSYLPDAPYEIPYGPVTVNLYAMVAMRHMYEYGTTSEQLAWIKVAAASHAQHNANAMLRGHC